MSVIAASTDALEPNGYCHCGCGRATRVPSCNNKWKRDVAGVPKLFVHGHKRRYDSKVAAEYELRDLGHETPCWVWLKSQTSNGYGRLWNDDRGGHDVAHRVVYARTRGPIPDGTELHHLCSVPLCVNPDHLVPLTRREHMARERRHAYGNPRAVVQS